MALDLQRSDREFDSWPPLLALGWMTVLGCANCDRFRRRKPPRYFTKLPRPTQPPTLHGMGNEYRPKCGDALLLWSRYGSFHSRIYLWVAGKTRANLSTLSVAFCQVIIVHEGLRHWTRISIYGISQI